MNLRLASCTVDLVTGDLDGTLSGRLAPRELQLLRYLAERPEVEVSRDELLHDVFGYSRAVQSRAVDKAMSSLRQKVESRDGLQQHLYTTPGGYRFVPLAPVQPHADTELDAFVGRGTELEALKALLERPGLVTVTGLGGVGKTRLARRALSRLSSRDAVFCELGEASSREDVQRAVALALGLALGEGDEPIGRAIGARDRLVLVLDNFERLIEHIDLLRLWRKLAPQATLLLTSRRPTHLEGERILRLEPLDRAAATELLAVRAAERDLDVRGDDALGALAERLDGLPLAIELAAARLGLLAPSQLLARLGQRLELLRNPTPGARHESLRGMLDESWEQLDGASQTALAQLSVFVGSFGLEAAEQVLAPPPDGRLVIEVLSSLFDHNLLQRQGSEAGLRFRLLETVAVYAAERLDALGPQARLEAEVAHGAAFARFEPLIQRVRTDRGVRERLVRELDNLLVACRRASARGDAATALQTCQPLLRVLDGAFRPCLELVEMVLAVPGLSTAGRAALSQGAALFSREMGQHEQAARYRQASYEAARECGRQDLEMMVLMEMGMQERMLHRAAAAIPHYESGLNIARALKDRGREGDFLLLLSIAHFELGELDQGEVLLLQSLELARALGNRWSEGQVLGTLGVYLIERYRLDEAWHMLEQALAVALEVGDRYSEVLSLLNLASVARERPDHAGAVELLERALARNDRQDPSLHVAIIERMGDSLARVGQVERALSLMEEAVLLARSLGIRLDEGSLMGMLAVWEAKTGRYTSAREWLRLSRELLREEAAHRTLCSVMCGWTEVELALGRREEALEALREAEESLARLSSPPLLMQRVLAHTRSLCSSP